MNSKEFFLALADLEKECGINAETYIKVLQDALVPANKKQTGDSSSIEIKINAERKSVNFYTVKTVVETAEDKEKEISLEDAQNIKKSYKIGDIVKIEFTPKDFGRIPALTTKQVVMQKLREIERENTINEFSEKEDELLNCVIRRIEGKNIYLEIGKGSIEGLLLPQDQVPGERYQLNDRIKVYVKKVRNSGRNAQILVSRSSSGLVKRLFENEVPEISQGIVVIKAISREAGQRTKIAIYSEDPQVDAVGACVGNKGVRVNAIVSELNGEKIDIIPWSSDPLEFIARAISPAKVLKVTQLEGEKCARVTVADDKLSLAIGRDGQNARLAARLTGWKIDVKSETAMMKLEMQEAEKISEIADNEEEENNSSESEAEV